MSRATRAYVKDEGTGNERWFVYTETEGMGSSYAARFNRRDEAEKVANAMNAAYLAEGRFYIRRNYCSVGGC